MEQSLELQQWHTQDFAKNDKLNQTYIGWPDRVNETQVQTVSANGLWEMKSLMVW